MHKFRENVKYDPAIFLYQASATVATFTGTGVDMRYYNNYCALVGGAGAIGTGSNNIGALTCYIAESTDNATFSATYLATATAASASSTLGTTFGTSIEIRAEQMSDGYRYLRVEVVPTAGTANIIAAANLRFNSRFPQVSLPA